LAKRASWAETDAELRTMACEEVARLEPEITRIEDELKFLLLPKDPLDEKDGCSKSAPHGRGRSYAVRRRDFRMYGRFAETRGWKWN